MDCNTLKSYIADLNNVDINGGKILFMFRKVEIKCLKNMMERYISKVFLCYFKLC
jgi:hypothetical protein